MAATEQADEQVIDDRLLADDDLGDLLADSLRASRSRATMAASSFESSAGTFDERLGVSSFPSVAGLFRLGSHSSRFFFIASRMTDTVLEDPRPRHRRPEVCSTRPYPVWLTRRSRLVIRASPYSHWGLSSTLAL